MIKDYDETLEDKEKVNRVEKWHTEAADVAKDCTFSSQLGIRHLALSYFILFFYSTSFYQSIPKELCWFSPPSSLWVHLFFFFSTRNFNKNARLQKLYDQLQIYYLFISSLRSRDGENCFLSLIKRTGKESLIFISHRLFFAAISFEIKFNRFLSVVFGFSHRTHLRLEVFAIKPPRRAHFWNRIEK